MRKLLVGFVALALAAVTLSIANAAMNLRQNNDGTADWVTSRGTAVAVGQVVLSTTFHDIRALTTNFVVVPFDGTIVKSETILHGATGGGGNAYFAFGSTPYAVLTVEQANTASGARYVSSTTQEVVAGEVIHVGVTGGTPNKVDATLFITIEPR